MNFVVGVLNQLFGVIGTYFLYQLIRQFIAVKKNSFFKLIFIFILFCSIALPIYPNDLSNVTFLFLFFFGV